MHCKDWTSYQRAAYAKARMNLLPRGWFSRTCSLSGVLFQNVCAMLRLQRMREHASQLLQDTV